MQTHLDGAAEGGFFETGEECACPAQIVGGLLVESRSQRSGAMKLAVGVKLVESRSSWQGAITPRNRGRELGGAGTLHSGGACTRVAHELVMKSPAQRSVRTLHAEVRRRSERWSGVLEGNAEQ